MLKWLKAVVVLALVLIGGLAVLLHHYWGWKGLIAFPFLLLMILWLVKALVKLVVNDKLAGGIIMGLFRMKGAVLDGASVEWHSVRPVPKPKGLEEEDAEQPETPTAQAAERPKNYYEFDLTISPTEAKCARLWEPDELVLTSAPQKRLDGVADDTVGIPCECSKVWDGSKFTEEDNDDGKYDGARRLKMVFEIDAGIRTAHLNYYGYSLGAVSLPEWTPPAMETAAPAP